MKSLSTRYITVSFVGISIAFIVSAILLHSTISNIIAAEFDSLLIIKAKTLEEMIEVSKGKMATFTLDSNEFPDRDRFHQPQYFEIYAVGSNEILARSRNLGDTHLEPFCLPHLGATHYKDVVLPDHSSGRQLSYTFIPHLEKAGGVSHTFCIVVAKNSSEISRVLQKVDEEIVVWGGSSLVVLLPLVWLIVNSSLKPIRKLSSQIERIDVNSFTTRIDPQGAPEELLVVVNTLNVVLEKMKDTFQRERTFVSNAAHDLRTPLSALRVILEVTGARSRTGEEYKAALDKCQSIVASLELLLVSLLTLARLEDGITHEPDSPLDLVGIVKESMHLHEAKIATKNVVLQVELPSTEVLVSNAYRIRLAINNLLDNAVSYVNQGGTISSSLRITNTAIIFELSNSGASLSEEELAHVFERFWRGDTARELSENHHGLGLSIVRQAIVSINGTVQCVCKNGNFVVVLQIPKTTTL